MNKKMINGNSPCPKIKKKSKRGGLLPKYVLAYSQRIQLLKELDQHEEGCSNSVCTKCYFKKYIKKKPQTNHGPNSALTWQGVIIFSWISVLQNTENLWKNNISLQLNVCGIPERSESCRLCATEWKGIPLPCIDFSPLSFSLVHDFWGREIF